MKKNKFVIFFVGLIVILGLTSCERDRETWVPAKINIGEEAGINPSGQVGARIDLEKQSDVFDLGGKKLRARNLSFIGGGFIIDSDVSYAYATVLLWSGNREVSRLELGKGRVGNNEYFDRGANDFLALAIDEVNYSNIVTFEVILRTTLGRTDRIFINIRMDVEARID